MLLLTRRVNESIIIGGNIKIVFLQVTYGQFRVGIDAPRDITVHRSEIQARIDHDEAMGFCNKRIINGNACERDRRGQDE